ncbi:MAG: fluoride efflux transporter CrcB [Bacteroidota bacterium]
MKLLLIVGAGGFIGSASRYALAGLIQNKVLSSFPFGTFSVNLVGCFLIGMLFALTERGNLNPEWRIFFVTGICGGFTTFSAFSAESLALIRDGQLSLAFMYIMASVTFGLLTTFAGYELLK